MKNKKDIPHRNKSPYGWWIASYIIRFEYYDEDKVNLDRRCLAWQNTIIVNGKNREIAYKKAIKEGKANAGSEAWDESNRKGKWIFEGLTSLVPIYDELEDGAEILWREYQNKAVKTIKSYIKSKNELETFIDEET